MTTAKDVLPFRRKREGKTNYKKRLSLLKSGMPRLVIRKSNKHILLQLIEYKADGDHVVLTLSSKTLLKHGWNHSTKSVPAAFLTGFLFGKAAKEKRRAEAILDIGIQQHRAGTRIYAAVKGAIDAGMRIPVGEEVFPDGSRINGLHLTTAKQDEVIALAKKLGATLPPPDVKMKEKKEEKKVPEKGTQAPMQPVHPDRVPKQERPDHVKKDERKGDKKTK